MQNDFQQFLGKKILESMIFLGALGFGVYLITRYLYRAPFHLRIFHFEYELPPAINVIVGVFLCGFSVWFFFEVVLKGQSVE